VAGVSGGIRQCPSAARLEHVLEFLTSNHPTNNQTCAFPLIPPVYQLVHQQGPLELPDLKAALDRTLRLNRTIKTQKLRAYLAALPQHFYLEDYVVSSDVSHGPAVLQRVHAKGELS
jgi:hypothetical protein